MEENLKKILKSITMTGSIIILWEGIPFASKMTYVSSNISMLGIKEGEAGIDGFLEKKLVSSDGKRVCQANRASVKEGLCNSYEIEYKYIDIKGRTYWLKEITNVVNSSDKTYGETVIRDITETKLQEDLIEAYNKTLRDNMSDQFKKLNLDEIKFELRNVMNLKELQMYQNIFCEAEKIFGVCFDENINRLTRMSINSEDKSILYSFISRSKLYGMMSRLAEAVIEKGEMITTDSEYKSIYQIGIPIVYEGEIKGVWAIFYISKEECKGELTEQISRKIYKTQINDIITLLNAMSTKIISASYSTAKAIEENKRSEIAKGNMENEYRKSAALTSVLQILDADQDFEESILLVFNIVGDFLGIDRAILVGVDEVTSSYCIKTEWCRDGISPIMPVKEKYMVPVSEVESGMMIISSDNINEKYARVMEKYNCKALIGIPIIIDGKVVMYAVFTDRTSERKWDDDTIKFVSDVCTMIQTILYKKKSKDSLVSSYSALREILDNIGSEICVIDKETKEILFANDIAKKARRKELVGLLCSEFNTNCEGKKCDVCGAISEKQYFEEKYCKERSGWFEIKYNEITWVDGRKVSLCNMTDVTEKKKYQSRIEFQANNDFLTGLYNRMRCEEDLEITIRETITNKSCGALLFMDLDNFKNINDGLGHQYGDILLKTISANIQQIKGIENKCYRVGGDEFIIIIESEVYDELDRILQELKDVFSKPWYLCDGEYYCTMSMGIVRFPEDGRDVNSLIRKADIAMYDAKKSGKNRYEYYNREEDATAIEKLDIEKNMRSAVAIGCHEFEIFIQPIIDIVTEQCIGGEALIRWNSGKLGVLTPGDFIPLAEHLGLITPIGEYVLRQACMASSRWSDKGKDVHINVNLSVIQLLQNNVVETISDIIKITGVKPENLVLEVTESLAINDMNRMKNIIRSIKELGVKIALDDFGTGYSSLNYIKQLDLDIIKVDRTFIKDITSDDYAQAFIKLITELSDKLKVNVCVEGVENKEQLHILRELQVDMIQGYYFGKPMPMYQFEKEFLGINEGV